MFLQSVTYNTELKFPNFKRKTLTNKLVTVVEDDQKDPFSIATTPGECYSFLWIAPLYPWYLPYIAEC